MSIVAKTIRTGGRTTAAAVLLTVAIAVLSAWFSNSSWGAKPAATTKPASRPARKNVKLPGLIIDFRNHCVDVEALVCLDRGALELIACTKGTKEHESIVMVKAKAMHIHAALLLIGAKPGNPAMQKPINKERTRWVHLPPAGDRVDVYLAFKNKAGKLVEHPIRDFVIRSEEGHDGLGGDDVDGARKKTKFPHTFLFAGSLLRSNGAGQRKYLSDMSGNVISISTFGDEVLCLPGNHARDDGALVWSIDAAGLPKVGSKVTLRLRPQVKTAGKTGKASKTKSAGAPATLPSSKK
jgi:hypothetical protein